MIAELASARFRPCVQRGRGRSGRTARVHGDIAGGRRGEDRGDGDRRGDRVVRNLGHVPTARHRDPDGVVGEPLTTAIDITRISASQTGPTGRNADVPGTAAASVVGGPCATEPPTYAVATTHVATSARQPRFLMNQKDRAPTPGGGCSLAATTTAVRGAWAGRAAAAAPNRDDGASRDTAWRPWRRCAFGNWPPGSPTLSPPSMRGMTGMVHRVTATIARLAVDDELAHMSWSRSTHGAMRAPQEPDRARRRTPSAPHVRRRLGMGTRRPRRNRRGREILGRPAVAGTLAAVRGKAVPRSAAARAFNVPEPSDAN